MSDRQAWQQQWRSMPQASQRSAQHSACISQSAPPAWPDLPPVLSCCPRQPAHTWQVVLSGGDARQHKQPAVAAQAVLQALGEAGVSARGGDKVASSSQQRSAQTLAARGVWVWRRCGSGTARRIEAAAAAAAWTHAPVRRHTLPARMQLQHLLQVREALIQQACLLRVLLLLSTPQALRGSQIHKTQRAVRQACRRAAQHMSSWSGSCSTHTAGG